MFKPSSTPTAEGKIAIIHRTGLELGNPEIIQHDSGVLEVDHKSALFTASKSAAMTLLHPDMLTSTGQGSGDATYAITTIPSITVVAKASVTIGTMFGQPAYAVNAKGKLTHYAAKDVVIHIFKEADKADGEQSAAASAEPVAVPTAAPAAPTTGRGRGRGKPTHVVETPVAETPVAAAEPVAAAAPAAEAPTTGRGRRRVSVVDAAAAAVAAAPEVATPPAQAAEAPAAAAAPQRRRRTAA